MNSSTIKINPHIFRMYDIRGKVNTDITDDLAWMVGRGLGTFLWQQYDKKPVIALGRDNRSTSFRYSQLVGGGLMESGCNVIDISLSTTPLLCYTVAEWKLDGGINITGSHNPPDENGFKLECRDAMPIAGEDIQCIRKMIERRTFISGAGHVTFELPADDYINKLQSIINISRPLKVVVDAGNGVAGLFAPALLRRVRCEVIPLYCEPDSNFPNHWPNPEDTANMKDLQLKVVQEKADIGFAFDGDGDRLGVVNEKGEIFDTDRILMLLARDLLMRRPGQTVMIDVKSSQSVVEDINRYGGKPLIWKTGHSLIRKKMAEDSILLAGEYSGHIFSAENYYPISDALLTACRILEILSESKKDLSFMLGSLPQRYSSPVIELPCPDNEKFDVVDRMTKSFSSQYDVMTIDGARIQFGNGWALIRASNTSPSLTLRFEADSAQRLKEIQAIVELRFKEFTHILQNRETITV